VTPEERKIRDILFLTRESFKVAEIEDPDREAANIISHFINCSPVELSLKGDELISEDQYRDLSFAIRRRFRHEPSQYITGEQEFYGYTFKVRPGVLIPRPETELLVDEVKKSAKSWKRKTVPPLILDLCTGSGALAVALAKELTDAYLVATDISKVAVGIAKENASALGVMDRIDFLTGDLYAALDGFTPDESFIEELALNGGGLKGSFDYIVSNPPYVSISEYDGLAREIKDYEPKEALLAGTDGLDIIRRIIEDAPDYLKDGGMLMIEIGFDHSKEVKALIKDCGMFNSIKLTPDLSRIDRVIKARRVKRSR
jgi:release factor glutamine methyltransferase